jgi:hypothetical protein
VKENNGIQSVHKTAALGGLFLALVCVLPARANLVSNGSFTGCNGSLVGGCSASSFAIGTSGVIGGVQQPIYNLTNWTMTSPNNLHCVVEAPYTNNQLCGAWPAGTGSANLKMFALPGASPNGGNYVIMDGDGPNGYSGTLSQTINANLIIGATYTLTFYQTAGQQQGNTGASTDFWKVTFGSQSQNSTSMAVASQSLVTPVWQQVTMTFTATSVSQTISFLSVGNTGVPPFLFLDGVDLEGPQGTPEPGTLSLILVSLVALPFAGRRWQKRG